MPPPLDQLGDKYKLIGKTIDASIIRLRARGGSVEEEGVVLQGAYLFGVRAFEAFLEEQIIHLCDPASSWGPKIINGVSMNFSRKLSDANGRRVKAVLTIGRSYVDYLPFDRSCEKASVLFARGRPFTLVNSDQKEIVKRAHAVRNLIAHESDYSLRHFKKVVCARYPLRAEAQTAVGYITYEQRASVPMIRQDLEGLLALAQFLS